MVKLTSAVRLALFLTGSDDATGYKTPNTRSNAKANAKLVGKINQGLKVNMKGTVIIIPTIPYFNKSLKWNL